MIYVIWKGVCHFPLVIISNLGSILHRLATVHPWRTDRRMDDNHDKEPALNLQLNGRPKKNVKPRVLTLSTPVSARECWH